MNLKNIKSIHLGGNKVRAILLGDRQLYPKCKQTIDEHDKHGINEEALNPLVISDEGIELLWQDIQNIDNVCPEVGSIPPIEVDPEVQETINSLADILFPEDGGDEGDEAQ